MLCRSHDDDGSSNDDDGRPDHYHRCSDNRTGHDHDGNTWSLLLCVFVFNGWPHVPRQCVAKCLQL